MSTSHDSPQIAPLENGTLYKRGESYFRCVDGRVTIWMGRVCPETGRFDSDVDWLLANYGPAIELDSRSNETELDPTVATIVDLLAKNTAREISQSAGHVPMRRTKCRLLRRHRTVHQEPRPHTRNQVVARRR